MVGVVDDTGSRESIVSDQLRGPEERARVESAGIQDADFQLVVGGLSGLANGGYESIEK